MQITKIVAHASAGFERFANFKPGITLEAVIGGEEDPMKCASELQDKAYTLVTEQKTAILQQCEQEAARDDVEDHSDPY